ncbi:hypothetical protein L579_1506 [Pantoea sp. AS-PWVM4]|uniref:coiled-coil domain-containing protein n=1 Tax=Pantoea sp. AS-PWVM4 TaxID=1332069 RepID=UPI0003AC9F19|nr:hypothetical protein [Pantoea sp. AS-PWVM4]ERK18186.1 hypothetical protein L579_1506 [Pantoea sp. AS-PWVM4]
MNIQQKENVLQQIDSFETLDFKNLIAENFKNDGDISKITIGDVIVSDFITLVIKVFTHFKQELDDFNYLTLPFNYSYGGDIGNGNLQNDLASFITNAKNRNFTHSLSFIIRLAYYQRTNGFWEVNTRRSFKKTERRITEENDLLETKKLIIEKRNSELDSFISKANESEERLNNFIDASHNRIKALESSLQNIINQSDNINNMFSTASGVVEKINSQLALSENKKKDIDTLHEDAKKDFSEIKTILSDVKIENSENQNTFDKLKTTFEEKLSFVEDKHDFFVERNDYLNDLIGREVGASLFETFKQRKNELSPSVTFWKWAVPVLGILCLIWISLLFYWSASLQMDYKVLIVNSLKALPAIGLLLFGIAQYGKERNYQEEYAFKSAVALTLNAYADQLLASENKDALILASVSSIYKSPIHHSKIKIEDSKTALDSLSDLISKIKEIAPTKKD